MEIVSQKSSTVAMVFPGQGSQKAGMLTDLAAAHQIIGQTFNEASDVVGFNVWQVAQSGEQLDKTEFTQPVLLTASTALWRLWVALGGALPSVLAGHSLGEYSALIAADCITLGDAVRLAHRRGQLMQQAIPTGQGSMAAVLGVENHIIESVCLEVSAGSNQIVDPANYNAPGQVVIAGQVDAVQQAIGMLKEKGAKVIMLPVSVPSHCRLMQPASAELAEALQQVNFKPPRIPVIQNTNAVYSKTSDATQIKLNLIDQLYRPVLWTQTMQQMSRMGVQTLVECGPGNVLSNLAKRMQPPLQAYPIDTRSRLDEALSTFALTGKII